MAEPAGGFGSEAGHFAVEEAAAAFGGAGDEDVASGDGDHGAEGEVDAVGDLAGLVEVKQGDGRKTFDGFFDGGE